MTIVTEAVFFVLAGLMFSPSQPTPKVAQGRSGGRVPGGLEVPLPIALVTIGIGLLVTTAILIAVSAAFAAQLGSLVALGEVDLNSRRADAALQLTVGGLFAWTFWLPSIALISGIVGWNSRPLPFWACSVAVLLSIGCLIVANFVIEWGMGTLSVEQVMAAIHDRAVNDQVRMPAETTFFVAVFLTVLVILCGLLSALVYVSARLGRHCRLRRLASLTNS